MNAPQIEYVSSLFRMLKLGRGMNTQACEPMENIRFLIFAVHLFVTLVFIKNVDVVISFFIFFYGLFLLSLFVFFYL